jgi:hypothetical protein
MRDIQQEMDIAKNIKLIEWLKTELLDNVSSLFRGFVKGSESLLSECLANIVISAYLLAQRIGISFAQLDRRILEKLAYSKEAGHQLEEWYGELSQLEEHFQNRR